jgi:hypothetical protein
VFQADDPAVHENVRYVKLAFFSCVAAPFPATPRNLVATRLRALEEPKALGAAGHDVQPGSGSEGPHDPPLPTYPQVAQTTVEMLIIQFPQSADFSSRRALARPLPTP